VCGIVGWTLPWRTGVGAAELALDSIRHRGPDQCGEWHDDHIFLGTRRLSIVDLAHGDQPIWNEGRTCCIIYNGELYNTAELRALLTAHGHEFTTTTDTEVVLHAYEEWGDGCLDHFNGMFAFAIWNRQDDHLFLARDRVGEKPLYYYHSGATLIFASEIKAILCHPTVPREIDAAGLANYLAFGHAVAPRTMYRDIRKLLPGCCLTFSGTSLQTRRYWNVGDLRPAFSDTTLRLEDYASLVRSTLEDAVARQLVADVPVGAFLSGGLDSSSIVALMCMHSARKPLTFSLGFAGMPAYNELADARRVAEYFETDHHEIEITDIDLPDVMMKLAYHYDEPYGDAASVPLYLLSEFARSHVKVALCGDGGDELFGGYRRHAADQVSGLYSRLPSVLTQQYLPEAVGRLPRLRRTKRLVATLPLEDPARRYASWLLYFTPEMQRDVMSTCMREQLGGYSPIDPFRELYDTYPVPARNGSLNRMLYMDVKTLLPDMYMEKTDKASMAASLEARNPLLDYRLVELAFQIPGHYKVRGMQTKRVLREAMRDVLPDYVLKKAKHGFSVPTDSWFRGSFRTFAFDVLLDDSARSRGIFNPAMVERLWNEHVSGAEVRDWPLWLLLNFELWYRQFMGGAPR